MIKGLELKYPGEEVLVIYDPLCILLSLIVYHPFTYVNIGKSSKVVEWEVPSDWLQTPPEIPPPLLRST